MSLGRPTVYCANCLEFTFELSIPAFSLHLCVCACTCLCVRVMIHGVNVMLVKTAKVLRYIAHFIALSLILSFSLRSQPCKLYAPIRKRGCERDVTHRCCLQQFHHNHSIDFQFAGTQILTCRPAQVEWDRIGSERTFAVVGSCLSALPSPLLVELLWLISLYFRFA